MAIPAERDTQCFAVCIHRTLRHTAGAEQFKGDTQPPT
nr:MAG TPA: hypothetical protein [Caudoviricetes sp.]